MEAVIFDKDGVLVDTEGIVSEGVARIVKKHSTIPFNMDDVVRLRGSSAAATFAFLKEKYKLSFSVPEILDKYQIEYEEIISTKSDIVMEGAIDFIKELQTQNIPYGIGTNSSRERTQLSLRGIEQYFPVIVTADDILHPKPAPDVFLAVSDKLGVDIEKCIVVGDTNNDALAAQSAGAKFVFFDHNLGLTVEGVVDLRIASMKELSVERLQRLFS